jgi:hypothetical protein
MIRPTLALLALASLSGCAANGEFNPVGKHSAEMTPTQLAAWSAEAKYPANLKPGDDLRAAAIVSKDKGTIKIYNFTDQPVRDGRVWVNRSFVAKVDGIAPQSKVTIRTDQLYDGLGNTLASQKQDVGSVQLQSADRLFNLEGPALE